MTGWGTRRRLQKVWRNPEDGQVTGRARRGRAGRRVRRRGRHSASSASTASAARSRHCCMVTDLEDGAHVGQGPCRHRQTARPRARPAPGRAPGRRPPRRTRRPVRPASPARRQPTSRSNAGCHGSERSQARIRSAANVYCARSLVPMLTKSTAPASPARQGGRRDLDHHADRGRPGAAGVRRTPRLVAVATIGAITQMSAWLPRSRRDRASWRRAPRAARVRAGHARPARGWSSAWSRNGSGLSAPASSSRMTTRARRTPRHLTRRRRPARPVDGRPRGRGENSVRNSPTPSAPAPRAAALDGVADVGQQRDPMTVGRAPGPASAGPARRPRARDRAPRDAPLGPRRRRCPRRPPRPCPMRARSRPGTRRRPGCRARGPGSPCGRSGRRQP